jgi:SAM-dependent methyltransferase
LSLEARRRTSAAVPDLFDMNSRALRRDRAARIGVELFLYERAFADCLERLALIQRQFERALLIGSPDPAWPTRLRAFAEVVEVREPGPLLADAAGGETLIEDGWAPTQGAYDLVLAIGTLDTVNDLALALGLVGRAMRPDGFFIGVMSGGDTLPQLRSAMRAADAASGGAAPHVHPRIEASALAPLLSAAGFVDPVVDVDRAAVSYASLERLVADLRAMGATNILSARPHLIGRAGRAAAIRAFADAGDGARTVEAFEMLHFAAWTPRKD